MNGLQAGEFLITDTCFAKIAPIVIGCSELNIFKGREKELRCVCMGCFHAQARAKHTQSLFQRLALIKHTVIWYWKRTSGTDPQIDLIRLTNLL